MWDFRRPPTAKADSQGQGSDKIVVEAESDRQDGGRSLFEAKAYLQDGDEIVVEAEADNQDSDETFVEASERFRQMRDLFEGGAPTVGLRRSYAEELYQAIRAARGDQEHVARLFGKLSEVCVDGDVLDPDAAIWLARAIALIHTGYVNAGAHVRASEMLASLEALAPVPGVSEILASALERAHAAAIARGDATASEQLQDRLRALFEAGGRRRAGNLASVLCETHAACDDENASSQMLDELRELASSWPTAELRDPLARALYCELRRCRGQKLPLLWELQALADDQDASHEQAKLAAAAQVYLDQEPDSREKPGIGSLEVLRGFAYREGASLRHLRRLAAVIDTILSEPGAQLSWSDRRELLGELYTLASGPASELRLRVRFAACALTVRLWPAKDGSWEDRTAQTVRAWLAEGAAADDSEAHLLLGTVHQYGRLDFRNLKLARHHYQRARELSHGLAPMYLRSLRSLDRWGSSLLSKRYLAITVLGSLALLLHGPTGFDLRWMLAYIGTLAVILFLVPMAAVSVLSRLSQDNDDATAPPLQEQVADIVADDFARRPLWSVVSVAAEDGFFLVPLLYIGITPLSAAIAAGFFGAAHFPTWSARGCLLRAVAYFPVALWILPHGIGSIVVGHLLWDFLWWAVVRWMGPTKEPEATEF